MTVAQKPIAVYWVDAFTQIPLTGNPAVVVTVADGLTAEQMQQMAREVNCSETAFMTQATNPEADLQLRWFTPTQEVDLCGHATVAAMHTLTQEGRFNLHPGTTQILYIETRSGLLPVTIDYTDTVGPWIWITLPTCDFQPLDPAITKQLGIVLGVSIQPHGPQPVMDDLNQDVLIGINDLEQLHQLQPDLGQLAILGQDQGWRGVCVYTTETIEPDHTAHSRFFAPQSGIDEDPVTGSVSGPLALYLRQTQQLAATPGIAQSDPAESIELTLEQGDALNRPGRVKIHLNGDTPKLGGQAITVIRGELYL